MNHSCLVIESIPQHTGNAAEAAPLVRAFNSPAEGRDF